MQAQGSPLFSTWHRWQCCKPYRQRQAGFPVPGALGVLFWPGRIQQLYCLTAALHTCAGKVLGGPSQKLDVRIKWPNDLYAGPHKLGGNLCQSVYRDQQFQVIMYPYSFWEAEDIVH